MTTDPQRVAFPRAANTCGPERDALGVGALSPDLAPPPAFQKRHVAFELSFAISTLNDLRRLHHFEYKAYRENLAWSVRAALNSAGYFSQPPMERASIVVMRYGMQPVDPDGAAGGCKPLLDVLVMPSPSHPNGLGVIVDDAPQHCEFRVVTEKAASMAEQRTVVIIAELEPLPAVERPKRKPRSLSVSRAAARKGAANRKRVAAAHRIGVWTP